jgi:hypothetical protein
MLVLEPGNIQKLKAGEPIEIKLDELLPAMATDLVIHYARDIEKVKKALKEHSTIERFEEEADPVVKEGEKQRPA